MDEITDRIRKYIIKSTIGKIFFSQEKKSYQLVLRQIGQKEKNHIFEEIKKYPEWKNATSFSLNSLYDDVKDTIDLCYKTKSTSLSYLKVNKLQIGNIVCLQGEDTQVGYEKLRLLYLGKERESADRFFVLSSARMALQPEDVLEVYNTTFWGIGHPVAFKVFRKGRRIPSNQLLYRTLPISSISMITPSIVHDVVDSRFDFSYEEYEASNNGRIFDCQLEHTIPAMGLLFREFTNGAGIFVDFDEEGKNGCIYTDESIAVQVRECSFLFNGQLNISNDMAYVVTEDRGCVRVDSDSKEIKIVKTIKAKLWKS